MTPSAGHSTRLRLAEPLASSAHRVDGDDGAFDRHHVEPRGNGGDFIGFLVHLHLPHHEALAGGEGRDHMDRLLRALLLMGAAHRLAIDGDDLGWRLGQRRDPGDEAALERLRIERGENIAQMDHVRACRRDRAPFDRLRTGAGDRASFRRNGRCR